MSRRGGLAAGLAAAAIVIGACGATGPSGSPVASAGLASEPAVASDEPSATAPNDDFLPPDLEHSIRQRRLFGLRSDDVWVRQVAADPRARIGVLDVKMLPEEEAAFLERQASFEDMARAVTAYGDGHVAEFGGVWIDQKRHTVVSAWTSTPEIHRIAVLASIGKAGPLEARLVRYSEQELRALQDRLFADPDWLRSIGAQAESGAVDVTTNRVSFSVSSANPQAPALILAHFGVPADMLDVQSDGTGILLNQRGTVHVTVRTADGKVPSPGLWPTWTSDRPGAGTGDCGEMVGVSVGDDGTFDIDCAPGGWVFDIRPDGGIDQPIVGRGHVVVPEGGEVSLTITLEKGANPAP